MRDRGGSLDGRAPERKTEPVNERLSLAEVAEHAGEDAEDAADPTRYAL